MAVVKKGEDFEDKGPVCSCGKPPGRGQLVQCDKCQRWFHFKCIRMTTRESETLKTYLCEDDKGAGEEKREHLDPVRHTAISGFEAVVSSRSLAAKIELAMQKALPNVADYKAKYRSLLLNLKSNKSLLEAVKDGTIRPAELVSMTAGQLATDKVRSAVESAKEASQRDLSFIEESGATTVLFKPPTPVAQSAPTSVAEPTYPGFSNVQPKIIDEMVVEEEDARPVYRRLWEGMIVCAGLGYFHAEAFYLESECALSFQALRSLLPHHFHVTGKLDRERGAQYLASLLDDSQRHLNFILVMPKPLSSNEFAQLRQQCADKMAVLVIDQSKMKDFYLMSLEDGEKLSLLSVPSEYRDQVLMGVVVPARK